MHCIVYINLIISMDYSNYKAIDFALDDSFNKWVNSTDVVTDTFWMNWLNNNTHKLDEIEMARKLILFAGGDLESEVSDEIIDRMWNCIVERTPDNKLTNPYETLNAVDMEELILTSIIVSFAFNRYSDRASSVSKSQNGELRRYTLPDGNVISLKTNEPLNIRNDWQHQDDRESWLQGDTFYKIKKK